MSGFRDRYGASPLHLLLVLTSFAVALYAGLRLLRGDTLGVLIWFVGAALVHDLLFLPVYSLTDRVVQRWCGPPAVRSGHDATPVPRWRPSTICGCLSSSPDCCCWSGGH